MSLRSQFKATEVSKIKRAKQDEDAKISIGSRNTDFLTIKDGSNKFRFFPKHPNEESFYHIRGVHWVTIEGENGDVRRTIPNARIHGGWNVDPIEAYIKYVKENLSSSDAEDADKIKKLTAWDSGLTLQTTWVAYANKMSKGSPNEFGLLEFKKTVRDALNDESIIEDEDEAITVDPFTDPDDGLPVLITYNSKAKKATDYYKAQMSKNPAPLTDDELEKFSKLQPLSQMRMFQYTEEDFNHALEGIQHFDAEYEIDLFDNDDFQSIIEDLRENFNEKKVTKKSTPAAKVSTKKSKPVEEEDDEEEDDSEDVSIDDMDRSELKKYISSQGLEIKILKSMSDEAIREAIRELEQEDEEEEEVEDEEEEEVEDEEDVQDNEEDDDEDEEEEPAKPVKKKAKTLDEIKAELRKKQGK